MKILAIRIKNLASLEGITEIDFTAEPLCSAGIFAITGATGAGKSTILDALCLALYGKTPRYLQAKETGIDIYDVQGSTISQGDVRGILRDGTAEGFAEVDFLGVDGQQYRAGWNVRRARNKAEGSMQADSVSLKNISSNIDIPGKKFETYKEIERLVGLNFEQFTRSVLLAQGDFTAFLKANKDEKSSLLEKLTGTHIYSEISKKIYEKYKHEEQQLRDLNLKKEGVVTLTDEELEIFKENKISLGARIEILDKEINSLNKEISWHEQLAQLQVGRELANTALVHATENKANATQRQEKLYRVDQAQQTRSWVDALNHTQQQQAEKTADVATLEKSIALLQQRREEQEKQVAVTEANLSDKNKAYTDALPLLEQAKKLDTLLLEKKDQLLKAKEESERASEKSRAHQVGLTDKQAEADALLVEIRTLEQWKAENNDRSPIAENKDIILSKLQDAKKLLEVVQSSTKELSEVQGKIKVKEAEKIELEKNFNAQNLALESLQKAFEIKSDELNVFQIDTINLKKSEVDLSLQDTIQAQAHWQIIYSLLKDFKTLSQKQLIDQSDLKEKEGSVRLLSQHLISENIQKETSLLLLQKARMAASENVEAIRSGLVENEPCPVCGSKSHPYVLHNPQLENVLTELEKAYQENESTYLTTLRQHTSLEQECQTLNQTIKRQTADIEAKELVLENGQREWEKFDISKECQSLAEEKKAEWIDEKLKKLKTTQGDLQTQIQAYASKKQQVELSKTELERLKEELVIRANQVKDHKRDIDSFLEQQGIRYQEQEKSNAALTEVEDLLSPYFTGTDWVSNWKSSPEPFLDRIKAFAQKWKENIEKLEHNMRGQGIIAATLKELDIQSRSLLADASQKAKTSAEQDNHYSALVLQRSAIFEGRAVSDLEAQWRRTIETGQQHLDQQKTILQQLRIDSARYNTQKDQFLKDIAVLAVNIKTTSQKIQDWLHEYDQKHSQSLSGEELLELLAFGSDWINAERIALQAINEEVTKATSVLAERSHLLEVHQEKKSSNKPLEELIELNVVAKAEIEQKKHDNSEISFQLQQDEVNKGMIGSLLKSILIQTDIYENWSKLNDIIGSADGKKFRQIAQEYTLDVLLGYANIHLEVLTNRYKIQRIPATLGLQVVDQDMGDEVRTVYSLSGGESFLVSLALALGLASLSSSRMKVESLFIDEGFGSLDPTTLNIAMDALERLHNQGRKVGVISHVQEMTERIPVQIKVSKMSSGKSRVEVGDI